MQLAVVILNWNAVTDTVRCVRSVLSWERLRSPVWVVDNASTDGSLKVIARQFPEARLIRNSTNLGFAGGNNRGILGALSVADAPILLLSNHARIEEDDVIRLLETLKVREQIGLIGPLLFDAFEKDRLLAAGRRNPALYHRWDIAKMPTGEPVQVFECLPGSVVLVRDKVFRQVGLLDVDYFYGNTVADLCLRARQHGYLSAVDARARALYEPRRSSEFRDALYTYYIVRNRFLLIRKFYRRWGPLLYSFWALRCTAQSVTARLNGSRSTAQAIWLGLHDGLRGRSGDQNKRVMDTFFSVGGRSGGWTELPRL